VPFHNGKFMASGFTVGAMNTLIVRARYMSLALLVAAVVDHGRLQDYSGATPHSSGLMRLGRDLMQRAGSEHAAEATASRDRQGRA
jgi:hypothetical protein